MSASSAVIYAPTLPAKEGGTGHAAMGDDLVQHDAPAATIPPTPPGKLLDDAQEETNVRSKKQAFDWEPW